MVCVAEKTLLLDEFSGQVQRHFPDSVWRSLFLERTGSAQFGTASRTLLCVECPQSGPLTSDGVFAALARLAPLYGGRLDPCGDAFAFVSFSQPHAALRMALAAQRATARGRLRMGLASGRCNVAHARADGQEFLLLLGSQRARVAELTDRAAAGTVQISPEIHEALDGLMADEFGSCVVMAEYDGEVLKELSLTLPPDSAADMSTFAGLGLT